MLKQIIFRRIVVYGFEIIAWVERRLGIFCTAGSIETYVLSTCSLCSNGNKWQQNCYMPFYCAYKFHRKTYTLSEVVV